MQLLIMQFSPTSCHFIPIKVTTNLFTMVTFRIMTPCGTVGRYQRFEETFCLFRAALKMEVACSSETVVPTYKSTGLAT
jgi:hypothetical protein